MANRMLELIATGIPDGGDRNVVEEVNESEAPGPRGILLFIARPGVISDSLLHAVRHEFPHLVVKQVNTGAAALVEFAHPIALILVEVSLLVPGSFSVSELARHHPQAPTAAIQPRGSDAAAPELLSSRLVRGVLPMDVTLDVWLSVIRVLLHGGEYFPLDFVVRSYAKNMNWTNDHVNTGSPAKSEFASSQLQGLTAREVQTLKLVSRGLQNKTIAAELQLSEHTVKIHIHNIITKLGVHNRTEAVARFQNESWKLRAPELSSK